MNGKKHLLGQKGFTLVELMIVVVVIAILTSIAIPSYSEYIRRTHRAHARAALLQTAQWMERVATAQGRYPSALAAGAGEVEGGRYDDVVLSAVDDATFTLEAVPTGPQTVDKCGTFTLTNTGAKGVVGASLSAEECWQR